MQPCSCSWVWLCDRSTRTVTTHITINYCKQQRDTHLNAAKASAEERRSCTKSFCLITGHTIPSMG